MRKLALLAVTGLLVGVLGAQAIGKPATPNVLLGLASGEQTLEVDCDGADIIFQYTQVESDRPNPPGLDIAQEVAKAAPPGLFHRGNGLLSNVAQGKGQYVAKANLVGGHPIITSEVFCEGFDVEAVNPGPPADSDTFYDATKGVFTDG